MCARQIRLIRRINLGVGTMVVCRMSFDTSSSMASVRFDVDYICLFTDALSSLVQG